MTTSPSVLWLVAMLAVAGAGSTADVSDLPLVEVEGEGAGGDMMAVIVTGDGGWGGLVRALGKAFAAEGIPCVGLNSLKYFWKARTPAESASALRGIVGRYTVVWQRKRLLLVGYSLGADVLPFMAAGLTDEQKRETAVIALLAPGKRASFEFHFREWFSSSSPKDALPIAPEVEKLRWTKVLCMYGEDDERNSLCPTLPEGSARVIRLGGGHHFGGDYRALAKTILETAR